MPFRNIFTCDYILRQFQQSETYFLCTSRLAVYVLPVALLPPSYEEINVYPRGGETTHFRPNTSIKNTCKDRAESCVCSLIEHSRHLSNDTRAVNLHRCTHPMRGVLQARQLNRDEARRFKTYAALINIPRLYRKWLRLLLTRRAIARERPLHWCL